MNRSIAIVLTSMFMGLTFLSGLCYATLFLQPNLPFNPLSPARATGMRIVALTLTPPPTNTPTATEEPYPATWTPTPTNTPGPTRTPTDTRTPTPTKTDTPTKTPTSTRTNTPIPPPPPPTITNTPTPFPFAVASHSSRSNCADVGLEGVVNGANGLPLPGAEIEYGEFGVAGSRFSTRTDGNGRYGALLLSGNTRPGAFQSKNWYAYMVVNGQRASDQFIFTTDAIFAINPEYCDLNDDDDSNDAGCISDPCESSSSIQVKIINWQQRTF